MIALAGGEAADQVVNDAKAVGDDQISELKRGVSIVADGERVLRRGGVSSDGSKTDRFLAVGHRAAVVQHGYFRRVGRRSILHDAGDAEGKWIFVGIAVGDAHGAALLAKGIAVDFDGEGIALARFQAAHQPDQQRKPIGDLHVSERERLLAVVANGESARRRIAAIDHAKIDDRFSIHQLVEPAEHGNFAAAGGDGGVFHVDQHIEAGIDRVGGVRAGAAIERILLIVLGGDEGVIATAAFHQIAGLGAGAAREAERKQRGEDWREEGAGVERRRARKIDRHDGTPHAVAARHPSPNPDMAASHSAIG